jgi:hypothetical protein
VKKLFVLVVLGLCFLLKVASMPVGSHNGMHFLSDSESNIFFKKFLQNRARGDFIFYIRLETYSKQRGRSCEDGVILCHQIGETPNYYIEITDGGKNFRKFLLKDGVVWTNFTKNFDPNEPFLPGSPYAPNDLLLPFLHESCQFKYYGPKRVCGRTTQQFVVKMDDNLLGQEIKFARVSIDSVFLQALEIEYLNDRQKLLSKQRVLSLCKRDDYWLPQTLELFRVNTRERSKITIVDSDFSPELGDAFFEPDFCSKNSLLRQR